MTHCSCQITVKLFYDSRKTSASLVKELPASSHRRSVPSRGGMFLERGNIASLLMIEPILDQSPEFQRVSYEHCEH